MNKKPLPLPVSQLQQYMVRTVMFIFCVQVSAVGYSIIVGLGVGV
jgi:hypothetical protein